MKVCVIGNSHAGMMVRALDVAPVPDLTCQFFASPGTGPVDFNLTPDGILNSSNPAVRAKLDAYGMQQEANLASFDLIVLVAMGGSVFTVQSLLGDHVVYGWPGAQAAVDALSTNDPDDGPPLLSRQAMTDAVVARIQNGLAHAYATAIRRFLSVPILVVTQPAPSVALLDMRGKFPQIRKMHRRGDGPSATGLLTEAQRIAFAKTSGVHVLMQPQDTLADRFLTRSEFTTGASRLKSGSQQPDDDMLHANARYGRLVWDQILHTASDISP